MHYVHASWRAGVYDNAHPSSGRWTVQYGHDWAERIENDIRTALPFIHITTHVEPLEDPRQ